MQQTLPEDKKIQLRFRVEPGCLGPEGTKYVDDFCSFAQHQFSGVDTEFVTWFIEPRHNKALAETEYGINGRQLSAAQAERYLLAICHSLEELEDHLHSTLANLIDEFMRGA